MDASIIILTKNAGKNFFTLLQRLSEQKFDGNYEIIVIDSGSTDGTPEAGQSFPVKMVRINPEEFHHGKTRNLGAELSNGRILVYITQDALPLHDDWLRGLTDDLKEPDVAMVVGRQIPWQDRRDARQVLEHPLRQRLVFGEQQLHGVAIQGTGGRGARLHTIFAKIGVK